MTASFLPSLPKRDVLQTPTPTRNSFPSTIGPKGGANLFVNEIPAHAGSTSISDPATPMPFPAMRESEDDYAQVQGVNVWEGDVGRLPPGDKDSAVRKDSTKGDKARWIIEGDGGWDVIYQGQAPVAYVRTPIQNPMLGLTASITLRDTPTSKRTHKSMASVESIASEATYKADDDDAGDEHDSDKLGEMEEIDLLGGLGGCEFFLWQGYCFIAYPWPPN